MKTSEKSVVLPPRSEWEEVDIGFRNIRQLCKVEVDFGKEQAEEVLNRWVKNTFDRDLAAGTANEYARHMHDRKFNQDMVKIMACVVKDTIYRINGMHVSTSFFLTKDDKRYNFTVVLYKAKTVDDMRALFVDGVGDGLVRSAKDQVFSQLVGREEYKGFAVTNLMFMYSCWLSYVRDLMDGLHERKVRPSVVCEVMVRDHRSVKRLHGLMGTKQNFNAVPHAHIYKSSVGALFVWVGVQFPKDQEEFVNAIKYGDGLSRTDPRYHYREFLKMRGISLPHTERLISGIHAFHLWKKGKQVSSIGALNTVLDREHKDCVGTGSVKRYALEVLQDLGGK
jgi:hypothetical protein